MKSKTQIITILPVLFGFFIMGFCDIVGISSDYVQQAFGWSARMTGFVPSMVFIWFLFFSVPVGVKMNIWGRKNTVLLSMGITVLGMILPLIVYSSVTCMMAYALLGIGNAMLQVSLNPLLTNIVTDKKLLTSALTAGQVIKALSSLAGPALMVFAIRYFGNGDNHNWYYSFPLLGMITLCSALWLWFTKIPHEAIEKSNNNAIADTFALLKDRTILLLFLGIFFVVAVDVSTNFISSKIMIMRYGWTLNEAGIAPQIYFLSRTIGAFLGAFLMTKIADMIYFRWNILLSIGSVLALAFTINSTMNLIMIGAIGFFCSCIFSIIYSMAVQKSPEKANLISGLMITAIAGGGAITPIIGVVTDAMNGNMLGGILVIMVCIVYLTYCAFCIKIKK